MAAHFAISRDGTLAYLLAQARSTELRPVWVGRDGQVEPLRRTISGGGAQLRISPDGIQAAFGVYNQGKLDIWIYDLNRHTLNPLTSDGTSWTPIWTPDGKRVVFLKDSESVFVQNVDGTGEPELLAEFEDWYYYPASYSIDGKEILIVGLDRKHPERDRDISVIVLEQNEQPRLRPFIQRDLNQHDAVWSPDGRWVAYCTDESGRSEVYAEPYPRPGPNIQISTDGGRQPVWSKDGKELFYLRGDTVMAVTIETEPEFRVLDSQELFKGWYKTDIFHSYDVAADGRFLMIQDPREPTPVGINIVLNWFEELKRLVPPGK
jgi:serine/threonine-protein kinase